MRQCNSWCDGVISFRAGTPQSPSNYRWQHIWQRVFRTRHRGHSVRLRFHRWWCGGWAGRGQRADLISSANDCNCIQNPWRQRNETLTWCGWWMGKAGSEMMMGGFYFAYSRRRMINRILSFSNAKQLIVLVKLCNWLFAVFRFFWRDPKTNLCKFCVLNKFK